MTGVIVNDTCFLRALKWVLMEGFLFSRFSPDTRMQLPLCIREPDNHNRNTPHSVHRRRETSDHSPQHS